ncbi:50S ribosomal protein L6 [Ureaplasma sp. ES3154-GEN]|uniref:50S ribosomal protein L6 n=1 Tax=Ureaplasma sp. ES3154-GEN TaxID=2984844 RepID=UPI0021E6F576|nr:50S ribosomal protein L6 [Ureaplasma sp. ES3154-GEN]MCV3743619.1 50S ribosomal protein L6 [Ureaplasma sp. ES3154-GEN]
MSRIGNRLLTVPASVNVVVNDDNVVLKNSKESLTVAYPKGLITVIFDNQTLKVTRTNDEKQTRMFHGTVNANLNNALVGLTTGWKKELDIKGVGFKAKVEANKLNLGLGFSHPVIVDIPANLTVSTPSQTEISVVGADKAAVGAFAATVRGYRPPEPYKGKGVMYKNEHIIRKAGKTADKKK